MANGGSSGASGIGSSLNSLQDSYPDNIRVVQPITETRSVPQLTLKSPYINPNALVIKKQYRTDSQNGLVPDEIVQVSLFVENTSDENITQLRIVDEELDFLQPASDLTFSIISEGQVL